MKQGKVVICNIVMMAISIAAIVTLIIGSFMKINLTVNLNGKTISQMSGENKSDQQKENAEQDDSENSQKVNVAAGGSESIDMGEILNEIDVKLPLSFEFKSMNLIKSVVSDPTEQVKETLATQVGGIVDTLMDAVDGIMASMVKVIVNQSVKEAEKAIRAELEKSTGGEVTEEEIKQELKTEYGIEEQDVETLKTEVSEAVVAFLNGGTDEVGKCLEDSETLDKITKAYAAEEWKKNNPDATREPTEAELNEQAKKTKDEIIKSYNETVEEFEVDGKVDKETVVVKLLEQADLKDEKGNKAEINDMDDVKAYVSQKINSIMGEDTAKYVGIGFKAMGIFVLVVVAAWAYFLIKLIVKTLFVKTNKTVGMFMPRFFGWMPHVFFVGLPMLLFGNMSAVIEELAKESSTKEVADMLTKVAELATVEITSLTWVSALATVLLFAIWIPYYQWRRQIKRELKGKTKAKA